MILPPLPEQPDAFHFSNARDFVKLHVTLLSTKLLEGFSGSGR
jgi:hypothetical protein